MARRVFIPLGHLSNVDRFQDLSFLSQYDLMYHSSSYHGSSPEVKETLGHYLHNQIKNALLFFLLNYQNNCQYSRIRNMIINKKYIFVPKFLIRQVEYPRDELTSYALQLYLTVSCIGKI